MNTNQTEKEGRPIKKEGYSSDVLHAKRDRKRTEAQARQREHDKLTRAQKLHKADGRRGNSVREWERLSGETIIADPEHRKLFKLPALKKGCIGPDTPLS